MNRFACIAVLGCAFVGLFALGASAQNNYRSYVSVSHGADASPCDTQETPCKTLSEALAKTKASGIITVIDGVTPTNTLIAKSITIDGTGATSAATPASAGFNINGAGIKVVLRGFSLDGGGSETGAPACNGVLIENAATVILQNITIGHMVGCGSTAAGVFIHSGSPTKVNITNVSIENSAIGVDVLASADVQLSISNTTISHSTGYGIFVNPYSGNHKIEIDDTQVVNNGSAGLYLAPGAGSVNVKIVRSEFDNNVIGIRADAINSSKIRATLADVSASNNTIGIYATRNTAIDAIRTTVSNNSSGGISMTSPALTRIGSSVVTGNGVGLAGPVSSYGNNQLLGNTTQGSAAPVSPGSVP